MIKECFNKLKINLKNKGIKHLEIFMNCIFKDLFFKLHNKMCINNFESLVKFEDELEELINKKCEEAKKEIEKYKDEEKKIIGDAKSGIALIKEIYDKKKYEKSKDFPFYEYFYYTDYLNKRYIKKKLKEKDENDYPVLNSYLKNEDDDEVEEDKYSLDNLNDFNKALNLFNDVYSNQITRDEAERQKMNTTDIYRDEKNAKLIDDFIELYNSFEIKDDEGNNLELDKEKNSIIDFLLIDDNKYGKSYKNIYKEFINRQNNSLEGLLNEKISAGVFNSKSKNRVSVQKIKESEIFTSENIDKTFTNAIFNSSYRKYINTQKPENYNEYEIRMEQIESEMTDSILKGKKLLNDDIIRFNFDNEVFTFGIGDLISKFDYKKDPINKDDKVMIYKFIKKNDGNNAKYKIIINNFITLIEYLNRASKDKNNKINGSTKICDIDIVKNLKNISKDFKEIFQEKEPNKKQYKKNVKTNKNLKGKKNEKVNLFGDANFNVSKITNVFAYFLELIFNYVKKDIEKYQEENQEKNSMYNFDDKDMIIKKSDLAKAIRLFITLVLYREEENDKNKKIKSNKKNVIDYLKNNDLWESTLYNNETNKMKFEGDLSKLKDLNIKIKEILYFYYYLVYKKDEGFEEDIEAYIKEKEEETKRSQKIYDNEDGDDDNDDDDDDDDDSHKKKNVKNGGKNKVKIMNKPPPIKGNQHRDDDDEDDDSPKKKNVEKGCKNTGKIEKKQPPKKGRQHRDDDDD
jgi:hypothetical protein